MSFNTANLAVGRVITGFSLPYVALYTANGPTVTYSNGRRLARGVDVDVSPEFSEDNTFYADNGAAESDVGTLTGGTLALTVDGLFTEAERLITALPAARQDGWTPDGDRAHPFVGTGFVIEWQSNGVVFYQPMVVAKVQFKTPKTTAKTREKEKDYQTTPLEGKILRDDTAEHNWRYLGDDFATEAEAEAALKEFLNISGGNT